MAYRTTHPTDPSKLFAWSYSWLKAACTIMGRRLHATSDAIAARLDWQVTSTHWGLGRTYRDPSFARRTSESSARPPGDQP
jgi:hypothetical protein